MDNKKVIAAIVQAFNDNDNEAILQYMTDDIEWHMLGDCILAGKQNIRDFFKNNPEVKVLNCTQDHFLVDGDVASVSGEIQCHNPSGKDFNMYYCDIYELTGGKVKKMITYGINKK
ncbi:MAG: nuclear transport factor 2 family protein [Bacteroidota bacterium]